MIGALLTWIPAIIVSYFTGGPDMTKFNIKLFAPFVQKMLLAKHRLNEVKTADEIIYPEKLMDEKASEQERAVLVAENNDYQNEKS